MKTMLGFAAAAVEPIEITGAVSDMLRDYLIGGNFYYRTGDDKRAYGATIRCEVSEPGNGQRGRGSDDYCGINSLD